MTFQAQILAQLIQRERALEASPARLERRRTARLLEAIARCCRAPLAWRLRSALAGSAGNDCPTG